MTQVLPPKKDVALALLERSNVDVYLDPRARGVVVPPQFRKEPRLILKIGLNMPVPIPDLRVEDDSMSCTLSFNRSPFYCVVPWSGVFAMVGEDGRGMVWPDDVPQELAVKAVETTEGAGPAGGPLSPSKTSGRRAPRGSKLAEDVPNRPSREGDRATARGRGGKKVGKKDDSRPMLVAVPSPSDRARDNVSAISPPQSRPSESARAVPPSPSVSGSPPQSRPDSNRPKRELPPYLRVVK